MSSRMLSERAPTGLSSRWALRSVIAALLVTTTVACNRNKQDAILMANEGDKALKGDVDSAIAKFNEATQIDPANHAIWNKLAQARWKKGDWAGTAAAFSGAIKAEAARAIAAGDATGHIFNLGHGVLPTTDADAITEAVAIIHEES